MFPYCFALLRQVKSDCQGVTALEFAIMAGIIVALLPLAFQNFVPALTGLIGRTAAAL